MRESESRREEERHEGPGLMRRRRSPARLPVADGVRQGGGDRPREAAMGLGTGARARGQLRHLGSQRQRDPGPDGLGRARSGPHEFAVAGRLREAAEGHVARRGWLERRLAVALTRLDPPSGGALVAGAENEGAGGG